MSFRHGEGPEATGNGFAFPPQSGLITNFIAMPGFNHTGIITSKASDGQWVRQQNIDLLAQEIGNYLGLYYTFPGWNDSATDTPKMQPHTSEAMTPEQPSRWMATACAILRPKRVPRSSSTKDGTRISAMRRTTSAGRICEALETTRRQWKSGSASPQTVTI